MGVVWLHAEADRGVLKFASVSAVSIGGQWVPEVKDFVVARDPLGRSAGLIEGKRIQ